MRVNSAVFGVHHVHFPAFTREARRMEFAHRYVYYEDFKVGDSWTSAECAVDHEEMLAYNRTDDP